MEADRGSAAGGVDVACSTGSSYGAESAEIEGSSDGICPGIVFGFFDVGDCFDVVETTGELLGVGDFVCCLG